MRIKYAYIKYDLFEGYPHEFWQVVANKQHNRLQFPDKEHAEHFLKQHPEAVRGCPYKIVEDEADEDFIDLGKNFNKWEGLEDDD